MQLTHNSLNIRLRTELKEGIVRMRGAQSVPQHELMHSCEVTEQPPDLPVGRPGIITVEQSIDFTETHQSTESASIATDY